MKRFFALILVCSLFAGCNNQPQLVLIENDTTPQFSSIPQFYHIKYMDLNSVTSVGWNKKRMSVVVKYPLDNTKNYKYTQEFDCSKRIVRNIEAKWEGDWRVIDNTSLENVMFPFVCSKD